MTVNIVSPRTHDGSGELGVDARVSDRVAAATERPTKRRKIATQYDDPEPTLVVVPPVPPQVLAAFHEEHTNRETVARLNGWCYVHNVAAVNKAPPTDRYTLMGKDPITPTVDVFEFVIIGRDADADADADADVLVESRYYAYDRDEGIFKFFDGFSRDGELLPTDDTNGEADSNGEADYLLGRAALRRYMRFARTVARIASQRRA